MSAPERPAGVPDSAIYFPPADDFSALEEHHRSRPGGRSLLRVAFMFVVLPMKGVMLQNVHHRALSVNRRTWSTGRCLCFTGDDPVPGVWAWTLAEERQVAS